jgi:hypothetical protein
MFRSRNLRMCAALWFPIIRNQFARFEIARALCNTARRSRPSQRPGTRRQPMSALPEQPAGANAAAFDTDAQETREWLDALSAVISAEGPERAHFLLEQAAGACAPEQHRHAVLGHHGLRQHHRAGPGRAQPRQPGNRRAPARLHALERDGHGGQGQPPHPADGGDLGGHISSFASRWRTCLPPASTTSGMPRAKGHGGDCSTSRATARPASMPAPSWKAA